MDEADKSVRGLAVIGICYVACAIVGASVVALQQMGQNGFGGGDAATAWLAVSCLAGLAGLAGAVLLARRAQSGGTERRIALVSMIFGAVIFSVIAFALTYRGVPPGSHPAPLPRTGANS